MLSDDMTRPEDDKPYKVYRAGRAQRRRANDAELTAPAAPAKKRAAAGSPPDKRAASSNGGQRPATRGADHGGNGARKVYQTGGAQGAVSGADGAPAPRHRRRFRWWFVPLALFVLLLAASIGAGIWAYPKYKVFDKAVKKSNERVTAATRAALTPDKGSILFSPTTLLILGVDQRPGDVGRSDTIMLMRFDPKKHTITQLSIPRDMRVEIPGYGYNKINAAYSAQVMSTGSSSPDLTIKTVEQFTGVPVNHIMLVDFTGLYRMVNAVGGIDVYVPKTVSIVGSSGNLITYAKGWRHFNGIDALHYSRIRKVDSDFFRMQRQQSVVQALEKKLVQPSNFSHLPVIGRKFMSGVTTDLTTRQLIELAYLKWRTPAGNNVKLVMAGTPTYMSGVDYVISDKTKNLAMIHTFLGE
jgi:LCP family protein required for cell wall assembly